MGYTKKELREIYDKNNGYCWHCEKKLALTNYGQSGERAAWEVDHSNPLAKGGTDYKRNLVPSCIPCNRSKGAKTSAQFQSQAEPRITYDDGCFIATAAYGSLLAPEINVLRQWRDNSLQPKHFGKLLIRIYYRISPPIARKIRHSERTKSIVRGVLAPMIGVLNQGETNDYSK